MNMIDTQSNLIESNQTCLQQGLVTMKDNNDAQNRQDIVKAVATRLCIDDAEIGSEREKLNEINLPCHCFLQHHFPSTFVFLSPTNF